MYNTEVNTIIEYLMAKHPLFYIQHSDYFAVKEIIEQLKKKLEDNAVDFKYLQFSQAYGGRDISDGSNCSEKDLEDFLDCTMLQSDDNQIAVLKDISDKLSDSKIISLIKEIVEKSIEDEDFSKIIFIFDSSFSRFPQELESLITVIDIKPLSETEIKEAVKEYCDHNDIACEILNDLEISNKFANSFKGLQKFQIEQILNTTFAGEEQRVLKQEDTAKILAEKKQLIKKSGILEIIDKPGSISDIGGLENLTDWLENKAKIFENIYEAQQFGVSVPKGILIVGMPGCGKSLTAKATAALFKVPLVRLDIGSLLGKYVGESEGNMKRALSLSEGFAPCVLWIDELEKAFAGIKSGGEGSEIVTRLFGQFLTWMQEKESAVFIVATANSISSLPPEFMRKGRFDELFKVELPTEAELKKIIEIKLKAKGKELPDSEIEKLAKIARNKTPSKEIIKKGLEKTFEGKELDEKVDDLMKQGGGCNGGDVESIINQAIENRYIAWINSGKKGEEKNLTFEDVKKVFEDEDTKSVSQTLVGKIITLREELDKYPFRNASKE